MTLILNSGGISALSGHRARLTELRNRGLWPPQVPSVVLAEALTGDARRDFHANHLLRTCQIRDVDEPTSREAARLRTATGKASKVSAVDAVVAAFASRHPDPIVLTSDPRDLSSLAAQMVRPITIAAT
jgi:predicted nucleic acid-binding protein